jgi:hypothetical protein
MGRMARVQFPAEARDSSLLYSIEINSGAHQTSYPMGTAALSLGDKANGKRRWPLTFT